MTDKYDPSSRRATRAACDSIVFGLFFVSLLVNLMTILFVTGPHSMEGGDEEQYCRLAESLLRGNGYIDLLRPPGWPMVIAAIWYFTGPSVLAIKIFNAIVGAFIPVGTYYMSRHWLDRRLSIVAGLITALLPTMFYLNATVFADTTATLGFIWANVFLLRTLSKESTSVEVSRRPYAVYSSWIAFGALMALINLVRPAYLCWMVLLAAAGIVKYRKAARKYLCIVGATTIGFVAVFSPWWVHNYRLTGRFLPFGTAGDRSLIECNNPVIANMNAQIRYVGGRPHWEGPGKFLGDAMASGLVSPIEVADMDEVEKAKLFRARALEWIWENPTTWLLLVIRKFAYAFGLWPLWQGSFSQLVAGLVFTCIFLISIPGWWWIWRLGREHHAVVLLYLQPLTFVMITVVFFGSWRYRSTYEPSFVIAALATCSEWSKRWTHRAETGGSRSDLPPR